MAIPLVPVGIGVGALALWKATRSAGASLFDPAINNIKSGNTVFDEFGNVIPMPFEWSGNTVTEPFNVDLIDRYNAHLRKEAEARSGMLAKEVDVFVAELYRIKAMPKIDVTLGTGQSRVTAKLYSNEALYAYYLLKRYFDPILLSFRSLEFLSPTAANLFKKIREEQGYYHSVYETEVRKLELYKGPSSVFGLLSLMSSGAFEANWQRTRKIRAERGDIDFILPPYSTFAECFDLNQRITTAQNMIRDHYIRWEHERYTIEKGRAIAQLVLTLFHIFKIKGYVEFSRSWNGGSISKSFKDISAVEPESTAARMDAELLENFFGYIWGKKTSAEDNANVDGTDYYWKNWSVKDEDRMERFMTWLLVAPDDNKATYRRAGNTESDQVRRNVFHFRTGKYAKADMYFSKDDVSSRASGERSNNWNGVDSFIVNGKQQNISDLKRNMWLGNNLGSMRTVYEKARRYISGRF